MAVLDFFKKKQRSGSDAKDRLLQVLISDRINCSPEVIDMIKNDIVKIISKYMEVDAEGLDIQITSGASGEKGTSISANIPILKMGHRAESVEI